MDYDCILQVSPQFAIQFIGLFETQCFRDEQLYLTHKQTHSQVSSSCSHWGLMDSSSSP